MGALSIAPHNLLVPCWDCVCMHVEKGVRKERRQECEEREAGRIKMRRDSGREVRRRKQSGKGEKEREGHGGVTYFTAAV